VVLLVMPITLAGQVVIYYDLRVRQEGFDLEMMAANLGLKAAGGKLPPAPPAAPLRWEGAPLPPAPPPPPAAEDLPAPSARYIPPPPPPPAGAPPGPGPEENLS
jgi:hypothetical protein